ncbi:hypothetical protein [Motilibacter aurantiacus]|uniref:hypothetical protein n=1 Tax=Motilibacter aurantiacus TaxID=2714955 RepID=UPI00140A4B09|nr:hypothetical protein [Motilibacter aurantiacus]NHC47359.1 hypothetical protein [Motilibacter aurantiacus]
MGAIEIDARNQYQVAGFWTLLSPRLRVVERDVRILARAEEMPDFPADVRADTTLTELVEALTATGQFATVDYEDQGARGTIFDPGADVSRDWAPLALEQLLGSFSSASASDLAHRLHAFAPSASKELTSAVARLASVETPEDAAQVAVSVRRCYEALADALYPATPTGVLPNGRQGGPNHFKNRLWAYIEDALPGATSRGVALAALEDLGTRIDAINDTNQKGVHAQTSLWDAFRLCQALIWFAWDLLSLKPLPSRVDDREALKGLLSFLEQESSGIEESEEHRDPVDPEAL